MHIGMLLQRAVNSREFMQSETMLEMATMGGARALKTTTRWAAWTWAQADVIAVDLSGSCIKRPPPTPFRWSMPATAPM